MGIVIEAQDLRAGNGLIVLDVRSESEYLTERLSGAVRVPVEAWEVAAKAAETGLENANFWHEQIGRLGISADTPVALYDDGRLTEAARVWFILQNFGVSAKLVNGGWAYVRRAYASRLEQGKAHPPQKTNFVPAGKKPPAELLSRSDLKQSLDSRPAILDARTVAEYQGQDLRRNVRGGHLPQAKHLAHTDLLDNHGKLKSADELKTLFQQRGFHSDDRIVTHCDGGGRAALAAIAALEAGFAQTGVYYLSFADWAKDETCPIVGPLQT